MARKLSLPKEIIDKVISNIKILEEGSIAIDLKVVKAGSYEAVLPVEELEIKKGETILAYFVGNGIWLLIPSSLVEQSDQKNE